MSGFGQRENEATSDWLRRLVAEGAPADVRADVRTILEAETRQAQPSQPGKEILSTMYDDMLIFILVLLCFSKSWI